MVASRSWSVRSLAGAFLFWRSEAFIASINYTALLGLGSGKPWGTPSTPNTLQGQTTSGNLQVAPDLTSLSDLVNTLNRNAQTQANQARIPGAPALESQSSANIGSELQGQLPQDVVNRIAQAAAERGIRTGNNNFVQSLGLDTLGLQRQGQQDLSAAYARNPAAPIFDPTTQFLTPAQLGQLQTQGGYLNLDWFKALNPQYRQPTTTRTGRNGVPNMDWFSNAMNLVGGGGQQQLGGGGSYVNQGDFDAQGNYIGDFFAPSTPVQPFSDMSNWVDTPSNVFTDPEMVIG